MKRNHTFYYLLAFCLTGSLPACSDDENEMIIDNDDLYIENIEIPTQDVVETRVGIKTAVFALAPGELATLFINRLTNSSITPAIEDDTEMVILDEVSAADIVRDDKAFRQLRNFYYQGGIIYMDQPALQQGAIAARLIYNTYNPLPDVSDAATPLHEGYIFRNDGAEKAIECLYNTEPHTDIQVDTLGNIYEIWHTDDAKPSEYVYGQFAESAAKFVNELAASGAKSKAMLNTRGNNSDFAPPPVIPIHKDHKLTQKFERRYGDSNTEVTVVATIEAKVQTVYSFDQDKDYYQIKLKQIFPGHKSWVGYSKQEHSIYADKSAGASYGGADVWIEIYNHKLRYNNYNKDASELYYIDGAIPQNESEEGQKSTLEGWNFGGQVGYCGGLCVTPSVSYSMSTSITTPIRELSYEFKPVSHNELRWEYRIDGPSFTKHRGRNGDYNPPPALGTKNVETEQAFNFTMSDTKIIEEYETSLNIKTDFYMCHGYVTGGAGGNSVGNYRTGHRIENMFLLPAPGRHKASMAIVTEPANEASSTLRKLLTENSAAFRYLANNPDRCAPSMSILQEEMSQEWQLIYDEVRELDLKEQTEPVTFYLQYAPNQRITLKDNPSNRGIRINTDGTVQEVR